MKAVLIELANQLSWHDIFYVLLGSWEIPLAIAVICKIDLDSFSLSDKASMVVLIVLYELYHSGPIFWFVGILATLMAVVVPLLYLPSICHMCLRGPQEAMQRFYD